MRTIYITFLHSLAIAAIADRITQCNSTIGYKTLKRGISVLKLFIVIAVSQPVNKNIITGAVITAKPGTEPGLHKL